MTYRVLPAIMSGGAGTRLWPASTDQRPKQFMALATEDALFTTTLRRVSGRAHDLIFAPPLILCNAAHVTQAEIGLADAGLEASLIILEPTPRNTAAAAAIAAAQAAKIDPDTLVLLLPADHVVADVKGFHEAIRTAAAFANERIVTFSIRPHRAATEYGYIRSGAVLGGDVREIQSFHEKPDMRRAEAYLASGDYAWNSGMFLFSPRVMLAELSTHAGDVMLHAIAALEANVRDGNRLALSMEEFRQAPSLPIDVAVMEKTTRGAVLPCDFGWADIGSWDEVWRLSPKDDQGNAMVGPNHLIGSRDNLVVSHGIRVCGADLADLVIIATPDAVLSCPSEARKR